MRKIFLFLAISPLLFLTSCSDDDCIDEVLGTYVGTESCPGVVNNLTIVVGTSSVEDRVVLSVSGTTLTFNGDLSADCGAITIPNQNISLNGLPGNIDGTFNVGSNSMTGNLTFSTGGNCSYNLTRQ